MKKIPLTKGMVALVSDGDYDLVSQFKWCVSQQGRNGKKFYAIRWKTINGKQTKISMHRFILGLDSDSTGVVDHLNGDGLDNRRENLEIVSQAENMRRAAGWKAAKPRTAIPGSIDAIDF